MNEDRVLTFNGTTSNVRVELDVPRTGVMELVNGPPNKFFNFEVRFLRDGNYVRR